LIGDEGYHGVMVDTKATIVKFGPLVHGGLGNSGGAWSTVESTLGREKKVHGKASSYMSLHLTSLFYLDLHD
jgi:hypothetical protein